MADHEPHFDPHSADTAAQAATETIALEVRDLNLAFGERQILCDISFQVPEGEALAIIGQSGSGKSTILKLILRLLVPDSGEIVIRGENISQLTFQEVLQVRQGLGMVFQASALFDSLSVYENVAYPIREHRDMSEDEIEERVRHSLELVDLELEEFAWRLPAQLSGGQRKRVGIARAIADQPSILLYDEPTSGLDPVTSRTIVKMIKRLQTELEVTSIVVTHDVIAVKHFANMVAMLKDCEIVFYGTPAEMIASQNPHVREFVE